MFSRAVYCILLLVASNAFMTTAWYLHLKKHSWTLVMAIGISWLIALPEYILQVPANRLGHTDHGGPFSAPQLKIMQEAVTIMVFAIFSTYVLKERLRTTDWIAFGLIFVAVLVANWGRMRGAA